MLSRGRRKRCEVQRGAAIGWADGVEGCGGVERETEAAAVVGVPSAS